jgi:hypothetical protein
MANSTEGGDTMGCCGQKRAALRARPVERVPSTPPSPTEPVPSAGEVAVAYRGIATAVLHRGASGRLYVFSHAFPVRAMAAQDATSLAGNPEFELR